MASISPQTTSIASPFSLLRKPGFLETIESPVDPAYRFISESSLNTLNRSYVVESLALMVLATLPVMAIAAACLFTISPPSMGAAALLTMGIALFMFGGGTLTGTMAIGYIENIRDNDRYRVINQIRQDYQTFAEQTRIVTSQEEYEALNHTFEEMRIEMPKQYMSSDRFISDLQQPIQLAALGWTYDNISSINTFDTRLGRKIEDAEMKMKQLLNDKEGYEKVSEEHRQLKVVRNALKQIIHLKLKSPTEYKEKFSELITTADKLDENLIPFNVRGSLSQFAQYPFPIFSKT